MSKTHMGFSHDEIDRLPADAAGFILAHTDAETPSDEAGAKELPSPGAGGGSFKAGAGLACPDCGLPLGAGLPCANGCQGKEESSG